MTACTHSMSSVIPCGGGSSSSSPTTGSRASRARAASSARCVQQEFGISQPAVSQHLRVLREHGFATVRADGRRRLYAVDARGPQEAQATG